MIAPFWQRPSIFYVAVMSENTRFYQQKMADLSESRRLNRPLRRQLIEILSVVADCERLWALEDRIERQIRRG